MKSFVFPERSEGYFTSDINKHSYVEIFITYFLFSALLVLDHVEGFDLVTNLAMLFSVLNIWKIEGFWRKVVENGRRKKTKVLPVAEW